jgi:hypothetical protein
MGNRAIYMIRENGENNGFTVHHEANALSPLLRLLQVNTLRESLSGTPSISHVFEHLDYDGKYQNPRLDDADMFCKRIVPAEMAAYQEAYAKGSEFEMRMVFDLAQNCFMMEYNPNCPWYRAMGSFSIDLDVGLENVRRLLAYAEERGITDFGRLLTVYHRSTGLEDKPEYARGYMRFEEYLDSPQAEEERRRYRELIDRQAEPDEEEMEER